MFPDVSPVDVIHYFAMGQHAFVACDKAKSRDTLVDSISDALKGEPVQLIDGSEAGTLESFAKDVVRSCDRLLKAIGHRPLQRNYNLSGYLSDTQIGFQSKKRQGYLIVNHIDTVIQQQHMFEIEGAFREVMQFNDDVAVLWVGSKQTILKILQDDRPFYLSFRTFWL